MAHSRPTSNQDRTVLARIGILILLCTAVLTLSFFGLLAVLTEAAIGVSNRFPFYALGIAAIFVIAIITLEEYRRDGQVILTAAGTIATIAGILLILAGEGLIYIIKFPDEVLASQQFLYLISAGLIATGLGYWGINHWREFADLQRY